MIIIEIQKYSHLLNKQNYSHVTQNSIYGQQMILNSIYGHQVTYNSIYGHHMVSGYSHLLNKQFGNFSRIVSEMSNTLPDTFIRIVPAC